MFWITLFLAIPALALAAAVWGVLRRKWYGVLPLLAVATVGWLWDESWWHTAHDFLHACANQSAVDEVMMLLLAGGAAVMALAALWAGWSRGWWFWRALVFAAVPASLVPLEANELVLLCLLAMPVLTTTAWFLRNRRDRFDSPRIEDETPKHRKQFSLANLLLAFIVLGLLATSLRSVLVGHIILADWGLLWLASITAVSALAMASPVLARGSGRKWLIVWSAVFAIGLASWWWLKWNSDPLGLAIYFQGRPRVAIPLNLVEGGVFFLAIVGLHSCTYSMVGFLPQRQTKVRIARAALLLLVLGTISPLVMVYPRLLPPRTTVVPLPPSKAHDAIQRAAFRVYDLQLLSAPRNQFLAVFNKLDRELEQPGHVTYDVAVLARYRVSSGNEGDPKDQLPHNFSLEMLRAIYDKRDADALRLARLQWRVGRTFYLGGTMEDFFYGFGHNQYLANQVIVAEAPWISEQECRDVLSEALAMERSAPDFETLRQFDDYWLSATTGWRDSLHDSAAWLTGVRNYRYRRMSHADFEKWRKRPLASLRTVQYVLALELYRREHGRFPDDLSALRAAYDLPEIMDPYTPFAPVYQRTDTGYLLYSVSADSKDNGGKFPPPNAGDSPGEDLNLVPNRQDLADQWRSYYLRYSTVPALPPAPKTSPSEAK